MKLSLHLLITGSLMILLNNCESFDSYPMSGLGGLSDFENSGEKYKEHGENPFIKVTEQAVSTFSVDADGGSYSNMRRYLNFGQTPPDASVRVEEYINYFTFDYKEPSGGKKCFPGIRGFYMPMEFSALPYQGRYERYYYSRK